MSLPSANDVHVDELLTSMSITYMQDSANYVSQHAAPILPVTERSGVYSVWSKADFLRRQMRQVADGDPSPEVSFAVDNTPQYYCKTYGGKKLITDVQKANATDPINLDRQTVNMLTQQALIERDFQFAANAWGSGIWTTDSTPGTTWEDSAGTPIQDIRTGISSVRTACGHDANIAIMGSDVFDELRDHDDIVSRYQYTSGEPVTEELLAKLFGLDKVIVAKGVYNTASAGAAATTADIFDPDDMLLLYSTGTPSHDEPSALYTFSWSQFDIPNLSASGGAAIKRWRNDDPDGEWLRAMLSFSTKVVAPDAGYFFKTCVA